MPSRAVVLLSVVLSAGCGRDVSLEPAFASAEQGARGSAPGQTGSTPGQSGTSPGQSGGTPGGGGAPPGQGGTTPGQGGGTPGSNPCSLGGAPAPDGTPCDNATRCDGRETCQAGACVAGAPVTCIPEENCHETLAGAVAHWKGDGDATDAIGSHHGALIGGATFAPGNAGGQAFRIDAAHQYVEIPSSDAFNFGAGDFTVAAWINPDAFTGGCGQAIFDRYPVRDSYTNASWFFWVNYGGNTDGSLMFSTSADETQFFYQSAPGAVTPGQWQHVAAVRAGTTFKMYSNGVEVFAGTMPETLQSTGEPLWIGNHQNNSECATFAGAIDDAAIYRRALSQAEIGASASCSAAAQCQAAACDPATGTCASANLPDGSACDDGDPCTQADSCQGGGCASGSPVTCAASDECHDAGACDPATGACSNPIKRDETGACVCPGCGFGEGACQQVLAGAVAQWRADGDASDSVGSHHGTLVGGATLSPGLDGGLAFAIDGPHQYVDIPASDAFNFGAGDFTVGAWINPSHFTGGCGQSIFDRYPVGNSYTNASWFFWVNYGGTTDGSLMFSTSADETQFFYQSAPGAVVAGEWQFVAAVRAGTGFKMYSNGVEVYDGTMSETLQSTDKPLWIGNHQNNSECAYFAGAIDAAVIYGRALSPGEIQGLARCE